MWKERELNLVKIISNIKIFGLLLQKYNIIN